MNAERSLGRLGAAVGREQDRALAEQPLADTDTILAGVARKNRRATSRRRMTVAAAMVACATIAGVGSTVKATREVAPVASQGAPAPSVGPRQAGEVKMPLRFEDGTTIVLQPQTRADLHAVRAHGAELRLDEGVLDVSVVHTEESRWDVFAGPFDVHVTGTKFDARWEPKTQKLTIVMREGSVRVTGPCVDEPLTAPNTKTFACDVAKPPASVAAPAADTTADPAPAEAPKPAPTPKNADDLEAKSAPALVTLADEARLGGDAARARRIYELVRRRFPASPEAARSAFLLGRMSEQTAPNEAAQAYGEVMRGGGAYAQEAHGRLMELEQRRGDTARARVLAVDYLVKFPNGPHRAYAASIEAAAP